MEVDMEVDMVDTAAAVATRVTTPQILAPHHLGPMGTMEAGMVVNKDTDTVDMVVVATNRVLMVICPTFYTWTTTLLGYWRF